jgi:uncharacterized membrane protein YhhN
MAKGVMAFLDKRRGVNAMILDESVSAGPQGRIAQVILVAALLVGFSYLLADATNLSSSLLLAWKGGGVWLLAIYAGLLARKNHGWLIALVMGMGALGDVLIERDQDLGALAFLAGHCAAIILYLGNRRQMLSSSQRWLAIVLVPAVSLISWSLTHSALVLVYSLFLAMMAASAWVSRFPRYWTGLGAMFFVASDLLIFARMGVLANANGINPAIWLLYFAGQVLIVLGVTRTLAQD